MGAPAGHVNWTKRTRAAPGPPPQGSASVSGWTLITALPPAGRMERLNLFGGGVAVVLGDRAGIVRRLRSASRG
jgi:hypothetical protein